MNTNDYQNREPSGTHGPLGPVFAGNLEFADISFSIGDNRLLENINLKLNAGETTCLLGPSGCGKSTLLRIAAGLTPQTTGTIFLDGIDIASERVFMPPERRGIGLMFQDYALFPHLTVVENVAFGLYALSKADAQNTAERALDRVGLLHHRNSLPGTLSGGEQQRVALARTIVPRPQVILMDEPFSGLDQRMRETLRAETLSVLKESRATTLLVTHDPLEALEVSDRIVLMRQGRIVQTGTPDEMYNNPVDIDAARFFSEANEFISKVAGGAVTTPLGRFSVNGFDEDEAVVVLVRPDSIHKSKKTSLPLGIVILAQKRGNGTMCKVQMEGSDQIITARLSTAEEIKVGDICSFSCSRNHFLAFKAT